MTTHFELHKGQHNAWRSDEGRPVFLGDEDVVRVTWKDGSSGQWVCRNLNSDNAWMRGAESIRLPLNHWATPALKAGYRPWAGGDSAPDDWDGGAPLIKDSIGDPFVWEHGIDELLDDCWKHAKGYRKVIGYPVATPKPDTGKTYPPELVERMVEAINLHMTPEGNAEPLFRAIMAEIDPPQVDHVATIMDRYADERDDIPCTASAFMEAERAKHGLQITEIAA